ncbi:MAG: hypothetical protein CVU65_16915 [Deltaproteobacteria bacterium HGW-Deltaproteobacteria-22]|jgi:hypothetical protein|nr:MAG: hypothetical protein CVU65_16915 [Deltaproteobacteria bacterium HGW-Deltaproteobacteria-22]
MAATQVFSIYDLHEQEIVRWVGAEMAIGGGGYCVDEQTVETGWASATPVVWQDDSIPYRQFTHIDMELADGRVFSLVSQFQDGTDFYGLYLVLSDAISKLREADDGGIYRVRELTDFPTGVTSVRAVRRDGPTSVVEAEFSFREGVIRFLSAEVHERDGGYVIVERDESVLVQMERSNA